MRRFLLGIVILLTTLTLPCEAQLLMIRNFPPALNAYSAQNWSVAEGFGGQMFLVITKVCCRLMATSGM